MHYRVKAGWGASITLVVTAGGAGLLAPGLAAAAAEEIVVTVRKEEESLQEVPISVNVLGQAEIERFGVNTLGDVTELTPSLVLDEGFAPQDTRLVIRGLAPTRGRQNAAFLQDGIDISSEAITTAGGSLLTNPRLFDLQRVEVVKGPQSALYGRSAFAGGINYVSKRPGDEIESFVRIDANDQSAWQTIAGISGPVVEDTLNLGFTAGIWDEEGYYRNSISGNKVGSAEGQGFTATGLFSPTDAISFFGRFEYIDDEFGPQAQATVEATETLPIPANAIGTIVNTDLTEVLVPQGMVPAGDTLIVRNSENPRTGLDYPGTEREIMRFSLIGEFDLEWGELTWFSHLANVDTLQFQDAQRNGSISVPNPPGSQVLSNSAESNLDQETDLVSQELRFSRKTDGPVDWAVGALYWREEAELRDGSNACFVFLPFPPDRPLCDFYVGELGTTVPLNRRFWERDTEHWSVYADIDWRINDEWTLGLEVRYAEEDLTVTGPDTPLVLDPDNFLGGSTTGPAGDVTGEVDDDYWAPKATLQWMPGEDLMFYASIAKGVKPAGISTVVGGAAPFVPDQFAFDQERVWVYEVGGKSTLADGKVVLNGAVFFQDFTDKQVSTQVDLAPGVIGIVPDNAGKAEIWGLEADVTWFVSDSVTVSGSYTWLDGEYTEFLTQSTGGSSLARAGNCTLTTDMMGDDICELDLSGRDLEYLPEHALTGLITYRAPLTDEFGLLAEFQAQYQSERYQSEFNVLEFQDYWLADVRIGLEGDNWDLIAYIDNVFDDDTVKSGFVSPDFTKFGIDFAPPPITVNLPNQGTYSLPDPRTYGIRASLRF